MSMKTIGAAALAAGAILAAVPASAGLMTSNGISVSPTGEGTFHVPYVGLMGQADYWCSAADYAMMALNASQQTRIYRASPVKQPARQGILFSMNAADSVGASGIWGWKDDGSMSVAQAKEMCQVAKLLNR